MIIPPNSTRPGIRWALLLSAGVLVPSLAGLFAAPVSGGSSAEPPAIVPEPGPGADATVRMIGFVLNPEAAMCGLLGGTTDPRTSACLVNTDAERCRARGVPISSDNTCRLPLEPCLVRDTQLGLCVDVARFQDPGAPLTSPAKSTADEELSRAYWSNLGHLGARLLGDLSQRWGRKKDELTEEIAGSGATTLPPPADLWGMINSVAEVYAIPDPKAWLGASAWLAPSGQSSGLFEKVRTLQPQAMADTPGSFPKIVRLRGRFASGLTDEGEPMPYDLFDGDPGSAASFLRQFYPYPDTSGQWRERSKACEEAEVPLACFDSNHIRAQGSADDLYYHKIGTVGETPAMAVGEAVAHEEFWRFSDLIGERLLQYGRREVSSTHTRILAALVAMSAPPSRTLGGQVPTAGTSASNPGVTDLTPSGEGGVEFWTPAQPGETRINYGALPDAVIAGLLDELVPDDEARTSMHCLLNSATGGDPMVTLTDLVWETQDSSSPLGSDERSANEELARLEELSALTRARRPEEQRAFDELTQRAPENRETRRFYDELRGGSDDQVRALLDRYVIPSRQDTLTGVLNRLQLRRMVEDGCAARDPAQGTAASLATNRLREQNRSRILMKHVEYQMLGSFPASGAEPATPQEMTDRASKAWTDVLSVHGPPPEPGRELPGNINPIAVCVDPAKLAGSGGPAERRDVALADPVFRRIQVDTLLVAPKGLSPEEALWYARGSLPFVFVDDPEMNRPQVKALIDVSASHAIYRARWELWTGWHMMWGAVPHERGTGLDGLSLRVGALCDDMVFAPEPLLPTLVRAGLLEGAMRGTTPALRSEAEPMPPAPVAVNPDAFVEGAVAGGERALELGSEAEVARAGLKTNPAGVVESLGTAPLAEIGNPDAPKPGVSLVSHGVQTRLDEMDYLRELIQAPLRRLQGGEPYLLLAFDSVLATERRPTAGWRLPTPYRHRQIRIGDGLWLRTAAWAMLIRPDDAAPVAPFREPNVPVEQALDGIVRPTWRRTHPVDFTLGADLGYSPVRAVRTNCLGPAEEFGGVVPSCSLGGAPEPWHLNTGSTVGLSSLATIWLSDTPRLAAEVGTSLALDMFPGGEPFGGRFPAYESIPYSLDVAPRFGVVGGLRWAPDPWGLRRGLPDQSSEIRVPWGADGADGSSRLRRVQLGVRGGLGLDPFAHGGVAYTVGAETWMAWSLRSNRSPMANLTPYRPNIVLGPALQWQRSAPWPFADPSTDYLNLEAAHQFTVSIRVQLRLSQQAVELPEAP